MAEVEPVAIKDVEKWRYQKKEWFAHEDAPKVFRDLTLGNFEALVAGKWRKCRGSHSTVNGAAVMVWLEKGSKMKRLYNEYLALNQDGKDLDTGAYILAKNLLDLCVTNDLDLRAGEFVIVSAIHALFSEAILKRATKMRKVDECDHDWGIDGAHTNVYCKKCFIPKPNNTT